MSSTQIPKVRPAGGGGDGYVLAAADAAATVGGRPGGIGRLRRRIGWYTLAGGVLLLILILLAVLGPLLWPVDAYKQNLLARNLPPLATDRSGVRHWLGTDPLGRDVAARVLLGLRLSLIVGVLSAFFAALFGVTAGVVAGYFRGLVDTIIMRIVDIQMSFPFIVVAMIWALFVGTGPISIVAIVALRGWVSYARVIRSRVLSVREASFIESARSVGSSTPRILFRHILPQTLASIMILTALEVGIAIIFESTLGFLGLGIQPPRPTLGNMLATGRDYLRTAWWNVVIPGIVLTSIVIAVNVVADGLRDLLDPRT